MVAHRAVSAEDGSKELLDAERYDEGHQQHQPDDLLRHRTRSRRLVVGTEIMQTG
jgi:hypothetical protein